MKESNQIKFYVISKLSRYVDISDINRNIDLEGLKGWSVPSFSKNGQTYYKVTVVAPQSQYKSLKSIMKSIYGVEDVKLEDSIFKN